MPTRSHATRWALIAGIVACASIVVPRLAPPYWAAGRLLAGTLGAAGSDGGPLSWATRPAYGVVESDETLAGLRGRRYAPAGVAATPHAVLVPGAHPAGIDEPRLARMARALAGEGITVHAVELPSLRALRFAPDTVSQLARVVADASARAGGSRVAAIGISVTGGLLLQAALEPAAARALACVVAIGAHHDLRSVARAYAERAGAPGSLALDPYGARVLVAAYADALLPAQDVPAAREAIDLHVSEHYAAARSALGRLSPAGRSLIAPLLQSPRAVIPVLMRQLLERRGDALAALSPASKLGALLVPVFLLHGETDPVIPSSETRALAAELAHATPPPRVLVTPLLRHAEGNGSRALGDALRLCAFMADVLAACRHASLTAER